MLVCYRTTAPDVSHAGLLTYKTIAQFFLRKGAQEDITRLQVIFTGPHDVPQNPRPI